MNILNLPWKIDEEDEYIRNSNGNMLFYLPNAESVKIAEFVVNACNNNERLININKELVEVLEQQCEFMEMKGYKTSVARRKISKAREFV